ncbi:MAG: SMC-Scp complex subunit ScpB [bacterium]
MTSEKYKSVIEALVFAAEEPLSAKVLSNFVEELNGKGVDEIIDALNDDYQNSGSALQIVRVGGGFQMTTRPEYASWVKKMYAGRSSQRLSHAALETLSIIAFKQPISKVEVSAVRGVNSDWTIKGLLEKGLITIRGRGEGVGKPLIYATTDAFLQYFGINDINELPQPREIEELFGDSKYSDQIIETLSKFDGTDVDESEGEEKGADTDSND